MLRGERETATRGPVATANYVTTASTARTANTYERRSQKSRSTSAMSEPPSEGTGLTGRPLAGLLELTSGELSSGGSARLRGAPTEPRGGGGAPPPGGGGGPPFLRRGLASLGSGRATHATAALLPPSDTRITGTMTSEGAGQPASMAHNSCTRNAHYRFRRESHTQRERGPQRRLDVATTSGGRVGPKQSRRSRSAAVRGAPLARCSAGEGEGPRSPARINGAPVKSASRCGPELRLNRTVPLAVLAEGPTLNARQSRDCVVSDRHSASREQSDCPQDSFHSFSINEISPELRSFLLPVGAVCSRLQALCSDR
ncbi:uncharacterized protein LOC142572110 [Dermacentor variabilis]|uniref:uncharacterized protein LOC142572110 n=1 Tax=Dermacentor variabilis TaxID=34621 RepID=UPI003F5AEB7D